MQYSCIEMQFLQDRLSQTEKTLLESLYVEKKGEFWHLAMPLLFLLMQPPVDLHNKLSTRASPSHACSLTKTQKIAQWSY